MRVALIHDFLVEYGGGERVLEALHEMWPQAPVFTTVFNEDLRKNWPALKSWDIRAPKITRLPIISKIYKYFTFLYPLVVERLDLREFDVIISSSAFLAKGVITSPNQFHLAYVHTPARFLYHLPAETSDKRSKWYWRIVLAPIDFWLRIWDFQAAQRPDVLVANSQTTKARIKKFYRREAVVVNPPVEMPCHSEEQRDEESLASPADAGANARKTRNEFGDSSSAFGGLGMTGYFLSVSRLCAYKNVDLIIRACNELKLPLVVVGTGREEAKLKALAGPTIKFAGFVPENELAELYRGCRAFISAVSDEDFGITPVEAMGYGKPVIAYRSGGVTETVIEGKTGTFFDELSVDSLTIALKRFKEKDFTPDGCRKRAEEFSKEKFCERMSKLISEKGSVTV